MFPALMGNDFVYLNSGGSGPPSRETIRAMREADDGQPQVVNHGDMHLGNMVLDASVRNRLEQIRKQVARAA
jgi:aminoglycoside phosphotransferase (APT) family kinase protein